MRWLFIRTLVLFFFFCAPVCRAVEFLLPDTTGSYCVGTKAIELSDASRTMLGSTKQKRWMVQAYYPAEDHQGSYPYMPGTLRNGKVEGTSVKCHAKPDAQPFLQAKFPGIIFIPGLGLNRQRYTILCEELASQGYIILSLDQPYASDFVAFPNGKKITVTFKDTWKAAINRTYRYHFYNEVATANYNDVQYLLDHIAPFNEENLGGALTPNTLILMGHNFGGNVALILGFKDERIKAVINIDPKYNACPLLGAVGVPQNEHSKPFFCILTKLDYERDVLAKFKRDFSGAEFWTPAVWDGAFCDEPYFMQIPHFGPHNFCHAFFYRLFKRGPQLGYVNHGVERGRVCTWFSQYREQIVDWLHNKFPVEARIQPASSGSSEPVSNAEGSTDVTPLLTQTPVKA